MSEKPSTVGTGRDLSTSSNTGKYKQRLNNRIPQFDYASKGWYFITTCTHHCIPWFGGVSSGVMNLSAVGKVIEEQWWWLERYSYVLLDEFIVMPDHVHGIIAIDQNEQEYLERTGRDLSLRAKVKSLSELVGAFKMTSSKWIRMLGDVDFKWQRSFYDHIIRNEEDLNRIREYIRRNPNYWEVNESH